MGVYPQVLSLRLMAKARREGRACFFVYSSSIADGVG
jgi:hypothetical protein